MTLVWVRRGLVGGFASVGLVACGSAATGPPTTPQTAIGHVKRTRLSGQVEVCCDPAIQTLAHPGTNRCTPQAGHVSLVRSGRPIAASRIIGGRFSFTVTAGEYTVIAWNSGNGPWTYDVSTTTLHGRPLYIMIQAI